MPTSTNYEKFQTSNPVVRRLIDRFYDDVVATVAEVRPSSLLDAGCGEGETIERLGDLVPAHAAAVDISPEAVEYTAGRLPDVAVSRESVYELPFADGEFELVICLEVLEHLEDPAAGLRELARVSGGSLLLSVPDEPWFRLGSLLRGKYVASLGNHPEHVNHWNPRTFRRFLAAEVEDPRVRRAFPWLVASARSAAVPATTATAG